MSPADVVIVLSFLGKLNPKLPTFSNPPYSLASILISPFFNLLTKLFVASLSSNLISYS